MIILSDYQGKDHQTNISVGERIKQGARYPVGICPEGQYLPSCEAAFETHPFPSQRKSLLCVYSHCSRLLRCHYMDTEKTWAASLLTKNTKAAALETLHVSMHDLLAWTSASIDVCHFFNISVLITKTWAILTTNVYFHLVAICEKRVLLSELKSFGNVYIAFNISYWS